MISVPDVFETPDPIVNEPCDQQPKPVYDDVVQDPINISKAISRFSASCFSFTSPELLESEAYSRSAVKQYLARVESDLESIQQLINQDQLLDKELKDMVDSIKTLQLKAKSLQKITEKPLEYKKPQVKPVETVYSPAQVTDLEKRISSLEKLIGSDLHSLAVVKKAPILDSLDQIQDQMELLTNPIPLLQQIDTLKSLDELNLKSMDEHKQLNELYSSVEALIPVSRQLPLLAARLSSLGHVHTKLAEFAGAADSLISQIQEQSLDINQIKKEILLINTK